MSHDHAGRVTRESTPFYAKLGTVVTPPPANTPLRESNYDALGRTTWSKAPGLPAVTFTHDSDDGLSRTTVRTPRGYLSRSFTDVLGHLVRHELESPSCQQNLCATERRYDALGRLRKIVGPVSKDGSGGAITWLDVDGLGRSIRIVDPDLGERTTSYDVNGNIDSESDALGVTIRYEYDRQNRRTKKILPGHPTVLAEEREVTIFYDGDGPAPPGGSLAASAANPKSALGKVSSIGNGAYRSYARYDEYGRPYQSFWKHDARVSSSERSYGYPASNVPGAGTVVTQTVLPHELNGATETLTHVYDKAGTEIGLSTAGPKGQEAILTSLRMNARSDVVRLALGNGVVVERRFADNGDLRLKQQVAKNNAGVVVQAFGYGYDEDGNVTALDDHCQADDCCDPAKAACQPKSASARYRYDELDRLTEMRTTHDLAMKAWAYDGLGNLVEIVDYAVPGDLSSRHSIVQSYGELVDGTVRRPHAVRQSAGVTYHYDARGNTVSMVGRAGGDVTIDWNPEDMPVEVHRGATTVARKYFLDELLWKKVRADGTVHYLPGQRVELAGGKESIRQYYGAYAERDPDAAGALRFHLPDHLTSAAVVTDGDGHVIHRSSYFPYGQTRSEKGSFTPKLRFNGKEAETEMTDQDDLPPTYDYGARVYNPATGRWLSADTWDADGLNRYAYVKNNPVSLRDPDGHQSQGKTSNWNEVSEAQQREHAPATGTLTEALVIQLYIGVAKAIPDMIANASPAALIYRAYTGRVVCQRCAPSNDAQHIGTVIDRGIVSWSTRHSAGAARRNEGHRRSGGAAARAVANQRDPRRHEEPCRATPHRIQQEQESVYDQRGAAHVTLAE
jgi:RHS repeat-associated protein